MTITDEQVQKIIEDLQGTCKSLTDAVIAVTDNPLIDERHLTIEQHHMIDQQIFLCDDCNWWCEISEMSANSTDTNQICLDCE